MDKNEKELERQLKAKRKRKYEIDDEYLFSIRYDLPETDEEKPKEEKE